MTNAKNTLSRRGFLTTLLAAPAASAVLTVASGQTAAARGGPDPLDRPDRDHTRSKTVTRIKRTKTKTRTKRRLKQKPRRSVPQGRG